MTSPTTKDSAVTITINTHSGFCNTAKAIRCKEFAESRTCNSLNTSCIMSAVRKNASVGSLREVNAHIVQASLFEGTLTQLESTRAIWGGPSETAFWEHDYWQLPSYDDKQRGCARHASDCKAHARSDSTPRRKESMVVVEMLLLGAFPRQTCLRHAQSLLANHSRRGRGSDIG